MIHKISEEWERLGGSVSRQGGDDTPELQNVLKTMQGIQSALREMCQVSVTRTTLKSAVKEALFPLLREHGDEILLHLRQGPEGVRSAGESAISGEDRVSGGETELASDVAARLQSFEARIERLAEQESELHSEFLAEKARVEARLSSVDERLQSLAETVGEVNFRVAGIDDHVAASVGRFREEVELLRTGVEAELRNGLSAMEERIAELRGNLTGLIAGVEAAIPVAADRRAGEVEARLRKEIDDMVQAIVGKLEELRGMLDRVEGLVPRREDIHSVGERLARMEERFGALSAHLESIDSVTPELRTLGEKLLDLQSRLGGISSDVGSAGKDVEDLKGSFSAGLDEVRHLLENGIQRWEADQSQMLERLSAIRDSLRDQLKSVADQVHGQGTLWGKLTGQKEGSLKLSKDDWDRLSAKIEGIISGLESILAKRRIEGSGQ